MDAENAAKVSTETGAGKKEATATSVLMASLIRASIELSAGIAKSTGRQAATGAKVKMVVMLSPLRSTDPRGNQLNLLSTASASCLLSSVSCLLDCYADT